MINFSRTMNTPRTKKEQQNAIEMTIYKRYNELMAQANKYKQSYIELKTKDSANFTDANKEALKRLTASEYNDALEYYNKAQELKAKYPNVIK
jgi:hypothetical protein